MRAWYAFPAAPGLEHEAEVCARRWKGCGYRVAVLTDGPVRPNLREPAMHVHVGEYAGWATAVSLLAKAVVADDFERDVAAVVVGGHDQSPDDRFAADELAAQFAERFPDLFGVMQPTGDGFAGNGMAAVSPWLGAGWIRRAYGGNAPLWTGYRHFCPDSELWAVARLLGVYWERPDLSQYHDHWTRHAGATRPPHLAAAEGAKAQDRALFVARRDAGWPGHEPLPAEVVPCA